MVVVKIELWPRGIRAKAREIGRIVIANDGTGTAERGNYMCALGHAGMYSGKTGAWKSGACSYLRRLSPYHLLSAAISACLNGGRPDRAAHDLINCTRNGEQTPAEQATAQLEEMPLAATAVQIALLLTHIEDIPLNVIETWTAAQRGQAFRWAVREHLNASDNEDVERISMPEFLKPFEAPAGAVPKCIR